MQDFPGDRRDYAATFSVDKDVFLGIGADFEPYNNIPYKDFYRFNTSSKEWSRISDLDADVYSCSTEASTYTLGNTAYLTG